MKAPVRTVRVSVDAKDQLSRLKRHTGIGNWNVLCRWALCRSLADPNPPSAVMIREMSNVEMDWDVFAGPLHAPLVALLQQRCARDGLPSTDERIAELLKLHLHRGIATLANSAECRSIESLVELALKVR